jgi:hypothetical protein
MYVKTLTVRRADRMYRCLSLVDAHREGGKVRHELVCRIGEADEPRSSGQLDRTIAARRRHAERNWLEAGELTASPMCRAFKPSPPYPHNFSRLSLDQHFAPLGDGRRSEGFADTVLAVIANRLIDPPFKRGKSWTTAMFTVDEPPRLYGSSCSATRASDQHGVQVGTSASVSHCSC